MEITPTRCFIKKGEKMKLNWKLRIKNKATLTALCVTIIAFVYQILGVLEIAPSVSESEVTNLVAMVINLLAMLGIIVDPTTKGLGDSEQAMNYNEPRGN